MEIENTKKYQVSGALLNHLFANASDSTLKRIELADIRLVTDGDLADVSESDLSDSEFQLKRVYDWLMQDNRPPAQTKFTAGWQRNLAKEIEYRLSEHSR